MANSKLKHNFFYNVGYQILMVVLPLITAPYVSRIFGAERLGVYNYSYSVADYFALFAMLGVKNYGNRQIAMVRDDKKKLSSSFSSIYVCQLSTSLVAFFVYVLYILFVCKENKDIASIQSLHVLSAAIDVSWFFFGMEEFKITVMRNTFIRVFCITCIFVFVKNRDQLWLYTLISSGSILAGYISVLPFLKKYVWYCTPKFSEIRKHIKPNLLLFIPVVAVSIFNVMDKIMLGRMSDYVQVGLYGNTEKLMRIPMGIITALGTVMMPHISHMLATGQKERSKSVIEVSMVLIMCMGTALAAGLSGIGQVFAPLFFGNEFSECGKLLIFLSPTVLSLSWANVIRMQYLIPNKMDAEFTISTIIGATVNLIVNWLFIPSYGALGAIFGTLCAESALTFYQTFVVRKYLPVGRYFAETVPFVFFGILMSVLVNTVGKLLNPDIVTLLIQVLIGIFSYSVCVFLYINICKLEGVVEFKNMIFSIIKRYKERVIHCR